jgi:uncharacterized phage protein gp47/JayE
VADLPTPAELVARGQGVYRTAIDPGGTGAVDLHAGSRNDAMLSVFTGVSSRLLAYAVARFSAARLATAEDDDLDVIGVDLFGLPRKDAASAVGTVYLQRPNGEQTVIAKGSRFAIPVGTQLAISATRRAIVLEASADVSVGADVLKVAVPVVAQETGALQPIPHRAITAILDPLEDGGWSLFAPVGGDPVLAGGPPDYVGGGADRESNDVYRDRLRQLSTNDPREKATLRAIRAGALAVPGVGFATAIEPGDGTVVLYAGDAPYGFALPADLRRRIDAELLGWRALGIPVLSRPYDVQSPGIAATVYMARALANYDIAAIRAAAIASVKASFDRRAYTDELFVNALESALFNAHGEVQDVLVTSIAIEDELDDTPIDRPRSTDAGYGAVTALRRYIALDALLQIAIAPPRTA